MVVIAICDFGVLSSFLSGKSNGGLANGGSRCLSTIVHDCLLSEGGAPKSTVKQVVSDTPPPARGKRSHRARNSPKLKVTKKVTKK